MTIYFEIDHIDPMGQGVSKVGNKITFVPKVLPGENGKCQVYAEKSKVQFATLCNLEKRSDIRTKSSCVHFDQCPSCHYLHTDYKHEVEFKTQSLQRMLERTFADFELNSDGFHAHPCPQRDGYRNRMQLHYNKKQKKLGQYVRHNHSIVEIPECLIANNSVKVKIKELYRDQSWLNLVKKSPVKGHIEVYDYAGQVKVSVNRPYAAGGFTQVNQPMNELANSLIQKQFDQDFSGKPAPIAMDLFGGKGNLTRQLNCAQSLVVDVGQYNQSEFASHQKYFSIDIYAQESMMKLKSLSAKVELLILDPPRSGYKQLSELLTHYKPSNVYYMSCQADTAIRDLSHVTSEYTLEAVHLLDFFPSTYHYETLFFLKRK